MSSHRPLSHPAVRHAILSYLDEEEAVEIVVKALLLDPVYGYSFELALKRLQLEGDRLVDPGAGERSEF